MNSQKISLLLATGALLFLALVLTVPVTTAQNPNLLVNSGFEEGHYNQNNIAEITVPNGWRMNWVDGVTFNGAHDGLPAHRPETVVWNSQGGVPEGEEIFWRDGIYTLKIFKSWAPMYAAVSQDVSGLEAGRRYQLVIPVYTDIYDWDGEKVAPAEPSHGQIRLGASPVGAGWRDAANINYSGWFAATYADYGIFVHEFTATQADMTVWIEVKGTYPHSNNGFFIDGVALYALDEFGSTGSAPAAPAAPPVPAGPTATPLPPPTPGPDGAVYHRVQSGDTFWVIAVQYASTMSMSPEEALPRIQELNNNPAFLNVGQELLIVPPDVNAAAPVVESEEGGETDEASAAETAADEAESAAATPAAETAAAPETETAAVAAAGGAAENESAAEQGAALASPSSSSICVSVFADDNGDGQRESTTEGLLADAAVTVARGGTTMSTYVSDGINNSHCFENLEADTYQVQFFPPADYQTTTDDSWAVVVAEDVQVPVSFGAQFNPGAEAVAAAEEEEASTTDAPAEVDAANALVADPVENGGSPVGTIVIGAAVFLVVLAAIGVVLLRRA